MLFNFAYPIIVYKQESEPTGTAGALWYKASTDELFYYSTTWEVLNASTSQYIYDNILRNSIAILQLKAAASAAAPDYDSIVCDVFSDTTGYSNTINTGATTASFSTNKYQNATLSADVVDVFPVAVNNSYATQTAKFGAKITTNNPCVLTKLTKEASCTATKAYLTDSSLNVLASAAFSSNDATFSYTLADNTTYYFLADLEGASYQPRYAADCTFPYADTNFNWVAGRPGGADSTTQNFCIQSATTKTISYEDKIVQTSADTLPFTASSFQLYAPITTAGTGGVTFDVSFDNGAHYQTGLSLNTIYSVVNTGTQLIIKLNLNAGASAGTAEATGYALMVW